MIETLIAFVVISVTVAVLTSIGILVMNLINEQGERYAAINLSKSILNQATNVKFSVYLNQLKPDLSAHYNEPITLKIYESPNNNQQTNPDFRNVFSEMNPEIRELYPVKFLLKIAPVPNPTGYSEEYSSSLVNLRIIATWGSKKNNRFEVGTIINDADFRFTGRVNLPEPETK